MEGAPCFSCSFDLEISILLIRWWSRKRKRERVADTRHEEAVVVRSLAGARAFYEATVKSRSRHPCVQPSACNTNSSVVCSTHTMLSQVLARHCDIVSAHRSVRNQLSRATAARPVTHIHHRMSLFAVCIIRNRYGYAPWHYVTGGTVNEVMGIRYRN